MVNTYSDYLSFRKIEAKKMSTMKSLFFSEPTDTFLKQLRRVELCYNSNKLIFKLLLPFFYYLYRRISIRTGISIPKNVCDKGLSIPHFGSIVVNANCKIGANCRIQNNVNIGATGGSSKAPIIGNNVYIGPGAVIYGDILIADNCYIGANAVVNKSFEEPFSVIVGVPAKIVRIESCAWFQKLD